MQLLRAVAAILLLRLVLLLFLLLGVVVADRTARGGAKLAVPGHVAGNAAHDRTGDAARLSGRGRDGENKSGSEQVTHG